MKLLKILILVFWIFSGCATMNTEQRARTEGTAGGAAIGAVLGGLLGLAIGGDSEDALIGAGVGALVGSAAGYSYADNVARRRSELAGKEEDLDARIRFARDINEDTKAYNTLLAEEIEGLKPRIDSLVTKIAKNQVSQQELVNEKEALDRQVVAAGTQAELAEEQLVELAEFRARQPQGSEELDAEIEILENSLSQLKSNTRELAMLSQRL